MTQMMGKKINPLKSIRSLVGSDQSARAKCKIDQICECNKVHIIFT